MFRNCCAYCCMFIGILGLILYLCMIYIINQDNEYRLAAKHKPYAKIFLFLTGFVLYYIDLSR